MYYSVESRDSQTFLSTYSYTNSVWGDLLTAYNGQPITYDANGNPLSYRGMTLTWAKGRRLATLTKNSATTTYAYDRDGLRVEKTVGGVTHTYTYLGDRLVCEEWGSCYLYFIYDETGRPYGLIYGNGPSQDYYYFVRNLQGDVIELMEMNGETVAFYEYDPWGKLLSVKDASGNAITSATHIANINPIRYRGYYYDTESGFYYLKSRYYDPEICRFISPDAYLNANGDILGYNLFAYCSNSPVNYYDPNGNSILLAMAIGFGVGALISGAIKLYQNHKYGKNWYDGLAISMLAGGVGGAISCITIPGVSSMLCATVFGSAGTVVTNLILGEIKSINDLVTAITIGAVAGILGDQASKLLIKGVTKYFSGLTKSAQKTF